MAGKAFSSKLVQLTKSTGVLLAGFVLLFLQNGSFKAFGVLFESVIKEYHTNNVVTGGIFSFELAACYVIAGISGAIMSKRSNRTIGVIGGIFYGSGLVLQGVIGETPWHLFLFMGLTAGGVGFLYFAVLMAYVEHFGELFYIAYSLRDVFFYLGVVIMPPVVEQLRGKYGLRGTFMVLGAVMWNGIVVGILLKPKRNSIITMNDEETNVTGSHKSVNENCPNNCFNSDNSIWSFSALTSHPPYTLSILLHFLLNFNFVIWALYLVPYGVSLGYHPDLAAMLSTSGGIGGLAGKIIVIIVFSRGMMTQIISNVLPGVINCIALGGYIFFDNYVLLLTFSLMCGFSLSFADAATCAMMPKYLCDRHLRSGSVLSFVFGGIFTQLGGIVSGAVLDFSSSFRGVFGVMAVVNILIILIASASDKVEELFSRLVAKSHEIPQGD